MVDPNERSQYRQVHPGALLFVLPEHGKYVGYARHCVKQLATCGKVWQGPGGSEGCGGSCATASGSSGDSLKLPFYWACDDSLCLMRGLQNDEEDESANGRKTYMEPADLSQVSWYCTPIPF